MNARGAVLLPVLAIALFRTVSPGAQAPAQPTGADLVRATYTKYEYLVPMRDGARLFTSIFVPKDTAQKYPFLITRTPYSVSPYGVDLYPASVGPSDHFQKEGFIFVYQDARGRYMSEGEFQQVRPFNPNKGPKEIETKNAATPNMLVMGPWSHGGWGRGPGNTLGNLNFAVNTGDFFREKIQFPFFMQYLKDKPAGLPEAWMFLTGINEFRRHDTWPPKDLQATPLYFDAGGKLSPAAAGQAAFDEYISDPNRPVPYVGYIAGGMTGDYMTEDQRFASQRPDVLVYQTAPLDRDMVIAGPVKVNLHVSTTGTDADFVVKLIDVYPDDYPTPAPVPGQPVRANAVKMGGYQQLVRGEPFRGKYRNSFEKPEPFAPGKPAAIAYELPDVYHAFRKGHRVMVHVQSSWFPLIDRNPQVFMEIPTAKPSDFQKATQRVYRSAAAASGITVMVEK